MHFKLFTISKMKNSYNRLSSDIGLNPGLFNKKERTLFHELRSVILLATPMLQ